MHEAWSLKEIILLMKAGPEKSSRDLFQLIKIWKIEDGLAIQTCCVNSQIQIAFLAEVHLRKGNLGWWRGRIWKPEQSGALIRPASRQGNLEQGRVGP